MAETTFSEILKCLKVLDLFYTIVFNSNSEHGQHNSASILNYTSAHRTSVLVCKEKDIFIQQFWNASIYLFMRPLKLLMKFLKLFRFANQRKVVSLLKQTPFEHSVIISGNKMNSKFRDILANLKYKDVTRHQVFKLLVFSSSLQAWALVAYVM